MPTIGQSDDWGKRVPTSNPQRMRKSKLYLLVFICACLAKFLSANELPPILEARLLESRAHAAASMHDLDTAERLFERALQLGEGEISPEGLIRIHLLKKNYDEAEQALNRYGAALPAFESKAVTGLLNYYRTGTASGLNVAEEPLRSPEQALYVGLLLDANDDFERASPFLESFLQQARWGTEPASRIMIAKLRPECQLCEKRKATTYQDGAAVCDDCQKLMANPTWVRQAWHAPTATQQEYMENLLGDDADIVQQTYQLNTPKEMQSEIPYTPTLGLSELLTKLDPETARFWQRAREIATERGRSGPGTGEFGMALSEGEFDPQRYPSKEEQQAAYREARERGEEAVGEQQASRDLVWLLNVANWCSEQLPPFDQSEIKTRDAVWAYGLTLERPHRAPAVSVALLIGDRLSREQSDYLEGLVTEHPDSVFLHLALSGSSRFDFRSIARERALSHSVWLIKHSPLIVDSSVMSSLDREAHRTLLDTWNDAIHDNSVRPDVLASAAQFYCVEQQNLASALLARAMELDPDNIEWKQQDAFLQELMQDNPVESNSDQLEVAEEALKQAAEDERGPLLTSLVVTAYDAGAHERAEEVARELLLQPQDESDWNSGNAFHKAHLILGLLALEQGNLEAAKQQLLLSADTHGSPQLNTFGPNMRLAEALLLEGEQETVLKFLDSCSNFWSSPYIKQWSDEIKAGDIPDFGANLRY